MGEGWLGKGGCGRVAGEGWLGKGGRGRVQPSTEKSTCLNLEGALGVVAGDLPLLTLKHVSAATHGHLDL